jgi:hypothetical protein
VCCVTTNFVAQSSNFRKVVSICGVSDSLTSEYTIDCVLLGYETSLGGYRLFLGTCGLQLHGRDIECHNLNIQGSENLESFTNRSVVIENKFQVMVRST